MNTEQSRMLLFQKSTVKVAHQFSITYNISFIFTGEFSPPYPFDNCFLEYKYCVYTPSYCTNFVQMKIYFGTILYSWDFLTILHEFFISCAILCIFLWYIPIFISAKNIASATKGNQTTYLVTCIGTCRSITISLVVVEGDADLYAR